MTKIAALGKNLSNLPTVLANYEDEIADVAQHLQIKGKLLEVAQQEQCAWPFYYDSRKAELRTLVKYMDDQVARVRGELIRRYTENYSRALGDRVLNAYIDNEREYLAMRELYLEVEELYEKYNAVTAAFDKRGYALKDLTTAKVNQLHNLPA